MRDAAETAKLTGGSFALFDQAGALLDWDAGFAEEFAAAKDLIAPGASLRALLVHGHAVDDMARADSAMGSQFDLTKDWTDAQAMAEARSHAFDYRDRAGRILHVKEEPTRAGGLARTARDVTAERGMSVAFARADDTWCLDGDPAAEAFVELRYTDDAIVVSPYTKAYGAIVGLSPDFDLTDTTAALARVVMNQAESEFSSALMDRAARDLALG